MTESAAPGRLLLAVTKANWGGAQRYVFDVALAAREAGYEVLVVSGRPGELLERLSAEGIRTRSIAALKRDVSLLSELRSFSELLGAVREFRPDVVHGNSSKAGLLAAVAGRLAGVPRIVFTAHGWAFTEGRPSWQLALLWILHYLTVLLSHRTICVSESTRAHARSMPFVQGKLVTVRNGVDQVDALPRGEARAALAPSTDLPFWVGTVAELHPNKGVDVLVRGFALVAAERPEAFLAIIGEGQERERLETLVRDLGLTQRVALCGRRADAARYLGAFDAFALASRTEALGFVLLEAGRAGVPVAASEVGGIPEVLDEGRAGLLFPPDDPTALAEALERYRADGQLRERMGAELRRRVRSEFSKEAMAEGALAAYR